MGKKFEPKITASERIQTQADKIALDFKKEDVLQLYNDTKKQETTVTSWQIAVERGVAHGNTVRDAKKMHQINLLVKAVNLAKDNVAYAEERQGAAISMVDEMDICDAQHEKVLMEEAQRCARSNY